MRSGSGTLDLRSEAIYGWDHAVCLEDDEHGHGDLSGSVSGTKGSIVKRWHLVAGVTVVVSLFASGCTSSEDRPKADRKAQAQVVGPVKVKLDEIPALAVDEADTAPAGLVGDVWTVRLPATGDPLRPGLGVVGGVRAKLTAASAGGTFDVYDALATSADAKPLYSGTNPEVPTGVLRNGGVYRYGSHRRCPGGPLCLRGPRSQPGVGCLPRPRWPPSPTRPAPAR